MAAICKLTCESPMTRKEMAEAMRQQYHGSPKNAEFYVGLYVGFLDALGRLAKTDDGKLQYTKPE